MCRNVSFCKCDEMRLNVRKYAEYAEMVALHHFFLPKVLNFAMDDSLSLSTIRTYGRMAS